MGKIKFIASETQGRAWHLLTDKTTDFVGFGGAAGGGKSWLGCYWITIMCVQYAGTGWFIGRKELSALRKTTLLTLLKVLEECGFIPDKDYKYNQQQNVINWRNGSTIFLIDTAFQPSDPLYTRLGGLEVTGGFVDESAETDHTAIDILWSRCGRRKNAEYGLPAKFLETFNPAKTHVYTRYYKPWKEGKLPDNYAFIRSLAKDNPSPDIEKYIEGILRSGSKTTIERLIHGNFEYDDDPAALMTYDAICDVFKNTHVPGGAKYVTADIARLGGDRIVIIRWDGYRGKVQAYDREKLNVTTERIEKARVTLGCGKSSVIVDSDGLGSGVEDFGGFRGFHNGSRPMADPKHPIGLDGKRQVENYDNLKSQCSFRMAEIVNAAGLYLEVEDWMRPLIIQEMEQVKQKDMDNDQKKGLVPKDKIKEIIGRSPDFWDAIMMRIYFDLKPKFVSVAQAV